MDRFLQQLLDFWRGTGSLFGGLRSRRWSKVREEFLEQNPTCAVTGSKENLEVHHILPFHKFPNLELDKRNLITLSRKTMGCNIHLLFGHFGNYQNYNPSVYDDAELFNKKIIGNKLNQHEPI